MLQSLSRRRLLQHVSGAAIAGLGLTSLGCSRPSPAKITIANAAGALNLTMGALMKQQKFLESFNLDPELMQVADGSKILSGIVGGTVDVSMSSGFGQVFPAVERGAPLKILAGGALVPTTAMFTGRADIHSLKDLEGRTVGAGSVGALVYQLVVALLRKHDVDISKVKFVNIGSSADAFRAVAAGTVDAGPGATALIPEADQYHVRPIPGGNMSVELPQFTSQGAWTSDHEIATQRDKVVRTLAACAKLYRFVHSPEAREPFLAARRSVLPTASEADHQAEWNYIQTYKPFAVDLALSPERIRYIQQMNVDFKVQASVLPFEKVADMSLARDALKLLG
jgi:ABC-type nitrate/sulfonate/bicarbonate transport system substrate-binding protein